MSGFCTTQDHAEFFARYALMVRRYVDHNIQFQTTPQAGMGLAPGEYFRVCRVQPTPVVLITGASDITAGFNPQLRWRMAQRSCTRNPENRGQDHNH